MHKGIDEPQALSDRRGRETGRREDALVWAVITAVVAIALLPFFTHPTEVLHTWHSDIPLGHEPLRQVLVRSLREEGWPALWNPTSFGGMPLVSDPQAGLFYLPNWLHALTPPDHSLHWYGWIVGLHLLSGGFGMAWWLRGHGFAPSARVAGAIAFVLAGKWFVHLVVAGHVVFLPLVWLPWQLGLIDRLWLRPGAETCAAFALLSGLAIPGYHPQLLFYSHWLLVGYTLVTGAAGGSPRRLRSALWIGGAGALALAVSAIHWLPAVGGVNDFMRGEGMSYSMAAKREMAADQLLGYLIPRRGNWEGVVHVGTAATALAAVALTGGLHRPLILFFGACVVICIWYATGEAGGLHFFLFERVPGFDLLRIPTRALLILGLPVGYLAAAGLSQLCEGRTTGTARVVATLLLGCGVILVTVERSLSSGIAAVAFALPALFLAPWPRRGRAALGVAGAALLCTEMVGFALPHVHTKSIARIAGTNQIVERIAAPLGESRYVVLSHTGVLPLHGPHAQLENLRGYNPLIPRASFRLIDHVAGRQTAQWSKAFIAPFQIRSRPHLDLFNVRWVVSPERMSVDGLVLRSTYGRGLRPRSSQRGIANREAFVYENLRRLPRAALVRSARRVASPDAALRQIGRAGWRPRREVMVEDANLVGRHEGAFQPVPVAHHRDWLEMEVDAGTGGYLVVSEVWYPGWRAEVDGQPVPVHRGNGIFQVVRLGRGGHRVVLRYRPRTYEIGKWISLAGLVGVGALALSPRLRPSSPGGQGRSQSPRE